MTSNPLPKSVPQWLNKKFIEWEAKQGSRKTITEFAEFLGVRQQVLNNWMKGNRNPNEENIHLLAEKLDPGIYRVVGMVNPKNMLVNWLADNWDEFNPSVKSQVIAAIQQGYEEGQITSDLVRLKKILGEE